MTRKINRKYKTKDMKMLITAAGGRCSYNSRDENCGRLLVHNNTLIGEIAHIAAISEKGPRYNPNLSEERINSYDNLLWLCPTHHTIIDKNSGKTTHTEESLLDMKKRHEENIKKGITPHENYILYDCIIEDYSALSTLFYYVDINMLYSSTLELPRKLGFNFGELNERLEDYRKDLGEFTIIDKHLKRLFTKLTESESFLWSRIKMYFELDPYGNENQRKYTCHPRNSTDKKHIVWINFLACEHQENIENFIMAVITPFLASPKSRAYAAISGGLPPLALWGRR